MSGFLRRTIKSVLSRKQDLPGTQVGTVGDSDGAVAVADRPGYIWVDLAGVVMPVYNNRVNAVAGMQVIVGRDPLQPNLTQVLDTYSSSAVLTGSGPLPGGGFAPSGRYRWFDADYGEDPLYVELRQFMPFRPAPAGGFNLWVSYGNLNGKPMGGVTLNLTSAVPATPGKARIVLIYINAAGVITSLNGSEVDLAALSLDDIPAFPLTGQMSIAWVRLYNGQTAIYEARSLNDLVDMRFPYQHSHPAAGIFTDTGSFDGILSPADDEIQKALDTLDDHTHGTRTENVLVAQGASGGTLKDSHFKDQVSGLFLANIAATLTADRSYALQDADMTLAAVNLAQSWSAKQTLQAGLELEAVGSAELSSEAYSTNVGESGLLYFRKSHADILDSLAETLDTELLGQLVFQGVDSSGARKTAGQMRMVQNGASGASSVAGYFDFVLSSYSRLKIYVDQVLVNNTKLNVIQSDAVTDAVSEVATIDHETSGTAAAGFGARFSAYLESSTTARQLAGALDWAWSTATHATRTAYLAISATISGTLTERVRVADAVQIGDIAGGNYTEVENDGTLEFVGTAMVWDDLRIEPVARATGANAPAFEKYFDDAGGTSRGVYLYSFDDAVGGSEKEVHFTMQMPHSWAATDIHIHVHWVGAVSDTDAEPRWGLEYAWKSLGETFGDTAIVYANTKYPTDANVTAGRHYLTEFDATAPGETGNGLSSILIGRLFRDSADANDTYNATGAKCGLLYIDAHYELNTIGSRAELTK